MTGSFPFDAALDALYAAPLEAFVDERRRLARELRGSGDRAGAAELAKVRKPSAAAWALNHAARDAPELVSAWLTASADLRETSARPAQAGGEALRAAIAAHRSATAQLMQSLRERARPGGRPLSEDMINRARTLLQSATIDAAAAEQLRRGRVSEEVGGEPPVAPLLPAPGDVPPATEPVAPPRAPRKASATRPAAAQARREEEDRRRRAERLSEHERRIGEAEAEEERLAAEHAERLGEAAEAEQRLTAARRALKEAEAHARAAVDSTQAAEASLRAARARTMKLRAETPPAD